MKNILLVEDDANMREIVTDYFSNDGFRVIETDNGREALELFETNSVQLVLLDVMIPEVDGWSVCKRLRGASDVPIIMLTSRSDEDDKLMGYDLGADDYVTKPFSPKVLVAKVKMLLKRAEGSVGRTDGVVDCGGIEINRLSRTVSVGGRALSLAPKEYDLLLYLFDNRGIVLSRESIVSKVWGYDFYGNLRAVDTHVKKLRKKLGEKASCISTVIGSGYKLEVGK